MLKRSVSAWLGRQIGALVSAWRLMVIHDAICPKRLGYPRKMALSCFTKNRSFVVGVSGQPIIANLGTMATSIKGFYYE
jgi:hypothetical protein